ncbi:hypothetical protein HK405_009773, partial [Cladochytrium tenue]
RLRVEDILARRNVGAYERRLLNQQQQQQQLLQELNRSQLGSSSPSVITSEPPLLNRPTASGAAVSAIPLWGVEQEAKSVLSAMTTVVISPDPFTEHDASDAALRSIPSHRQGASKM